MLNSKAMFVGAVSGFVAAFLVDLHAWATMDGAYDWRKAIKRWVVGALSGAAAGAGIQVAS